LIILFALLAGGLVLAAWFNRKDRGAVIFFLACALLNAGAATHMLVTTDPHRFQLRAASELDD